MAARMSVLQFDLEPKWPSHRAGQNSDKKKQYGRRPRWLNSVIPLTLTAVLAASTSVDLVEEAPTVAPQIDILQQPLTVPPLEAMRDSPERKLEGKFVPVSWAALPSWGEDDFSKTWPVFINNCKGLMRAT